MLIPESAISRRHMLQTASCGFGYLAFAGLCGQAQAAAPNPLAAKQAHHAARAKRVIFIFMQGGPSQVDTFDYKPRLARDNGKSVEFNVARTRKITPERVFESPWKFKQYGNCGQWVSELFPHVARHVDDLCVIRSMQTEGVAHGPATLFLHTGATNLIRPSVGAWVTYGLGTENQSLPGFVTVSPPASKGGPRNYNNAFLPTFFQGTVLGRAGVPVTQARIPNLTNPRLSEAAQRKQFELLQAINRRQAGSGDEELDAVINSFELAYRMQSAGPRVLDLSTESPATLKLYGIGEKATDDFGRQCLLARRFAEAGVRYIQVNYSDNNATPRWDQHSNLPAHADHALATDKPVAGLLADLKARGLLEDTLVWWGGEFGRTPFAQGSDGRDHNPKGFTVWLAGGGVRSGYAHGMTDEYGYEAVDDRVHMHDLHATILHLLGMDHLRLTYRYAGRDFRLTDIAGRVVHEIIAEQSTPRPLLDTMHTADLHQGIPFSGVSQMPLKHVRGIPVLIALLFVSSAVAEDWPQFRGPRGNGVSHETSVPLTWASDKNVKWRVELPAPGNSSPIVSRGRVFVTVATEAGHKRHLFCFDRKDGNQLWVQTVEYGEDEPTHDTNPFCASTPAADGERVVVWHSSAGLYCYDFDGKELWHRDLGKFTHIWGYAASPIIYQDAVLLNCGPGQRTFVTAINKHTGETIWQTDEPGGASGLEKRGPDEEAAPWIGSWSTPLITRVDGRDQILLSLPHHVQAYAPESGSILWRCEGLGNLVYTSIVPGDGVAVAASGYFGPAIGFRLGGAGDVTETNRLWVAPPQNPQRIGSGIIVGDYVYMANEPGTAECINVETGERIWRERLPGESKFWGAMVMAEDRFYATNQKGDTVVWHPNPEKLDTLELNSLGEASNSTPAISDGQLFLRTFKALYCIDD